MGWILSNLAGVDAVKLEEGLIHILPAQQLSWNMSLLLLCPECYTTQHPDSLTFRLGWNYLVLPANYLQTCVPCGVLFCENTGNLNTVVYSKEKL